MSTEKLTSDVVFSSARACSCAVRFELGCVLCVKVVVRMHESRSIEMLLPGGDGEVRITIPFALNELGPPCGCCAVMEWKPLRGRAPQMRDTNLYFGTDFLGGAKSLRRTTFPVGSSVPAGIFMSYVNIFFIVPSGDTRFRLRYFPT